MNVHTRNMFITNYNDSGSQWYGYKLLSISCICVQFTLMQEVICYKYQIKLMKKGLSET